MSERAERIFSWVWRINGLLILGLAIAAAALAVVLVFDIGVFASRDRPQQHLAEVAGAHLSAGDLRLTDFRPIAGTQFIYAQLASPSEYRGSGSSGGWGNAHNLLFFDTTSKNAHWLLPDNDQIIPSISFLMDPPSARYTYDDGSAAERKQIAVALLLEIKESPQGTPTNAESRSIAIASPDGRELTLVARSTQGLLGYHHARKDALFVFYVSGGTARVIDVDPATRTVRSDAPLAAKK